jgi:hypothetical protein
MIDATKLCQHCGEGDATHFMSLQEYRFGSI